MKKPALLAAAALMLGVPTAIAFAQSAPVPAPVAPAPAPTAKVPAPATVQGRPAIWMVKDRDTTVYLFGTVHLMRPGVEWKAGPVQRAYDASNEVVLEMIPPSDAAMQQMTIARGIDKDGPPLTQKLDERGRGLYVKAMEKFGLPVAAFEPFQPWLAATVLGVTAWTKEGFDPNSGVDKKVMEAARRDGKKLVGLETAEEQLQFLAGMPEPLQIRFLVSGVQDLDKGSTVVNDMMKAWTEGKPEALATLMNEGMQDVPEIGKRLLDDRNARWAQWVDKRMDQPGVVFMAVGAGHLAGKNSLQDFLGKQGHRAVRVAR